MDLIFMGLLICLIESSFEMPKKAISSIRLHISPLGVNNVKKRSVPIHSIIEEEPEDIEVKRKRFRLEEPPLLEHLVGLAKPEPFLRKREAQRFSKSFESSETGIDFIEERLIEHGQALQQLIKMVKKNEDVTKQLVDNLSRYMELSKQPEKNQGHNNRRSYKEHSTVRQDEENPVLRIGKNLPKYGSLLKRLVVNEVQDATDPIPLLEVVKDKEPV